MLQRGEASEGGSGCAQRWDLEVLELGKENWFPESQHEAQSLATMSIVRLARHDLDLLSQSEGVTGSTSTVETLCDVTWMSSSTYCWSISVHFCLRAIKNETFCPSCRPFTRANVASISNSWTSFPPCWLLLNELSFFRLGNPLHPAKIEIFFGFPSVLSAGAFQAMSTTHSCTLWPASLRAFVRGDGRLTRQLRCSGIRATSAL